MNPIENNTELQRRALGKWIQKRRLYHRWTQAILAAKLGCTVNLVSKIERGGRNVSAKQAPKMVLVFGLTEEEQVAFLRLVHRARARDADQAPTLPRGPQAHVNLPEPTTLLIGREKDITSGAALLSDPHMRLLTLSGPPGIGKTQLGIAIARHVQDAYLDGVCFVPLAAVPPGTEISQTLFDNLSATLANEGLIEQPIPKAMPAALIHLLSRQHLLLVLDNFEHVLTETNLQTISKLLASCPRLNIITTSRSALNIKGEHVVVVSPLPVPDVAQRDARIHDLVVLAQQPVVTLFLSRAQSVNAAFNLTSGNAQAVCNLCAFSQGIPLVLELLAARVRLLSPQELLAQITSPDRAQTSANFLLSLTGPRDSPEHQRTLARAIEWSYDLLQLDEQQLLLKLSVFESGFTPEAAVAVCDTTLPTLESLVSHSLVQPHLWDTRTHVQEDAANSWDDADFDTEDSNEESDESRYGLLESIRAFALQRLRDSEAYNMVCKCHAAYMLQQVTEATDGNIQAHAADRRLRRDLENVRAALRWSHSPGGDINLGVQLTLRLAPWWWLHGQLNERMHWLQSALRQLAPHTWSQFHRMPLACTSHSAATVEAAADLPRPMRRAVLHIVAGLLRDRADIPLNEIKVLLQEQLTLARELDDKPIQITHLRNLLYHISNIAPDDPDVLEIEQQAITLAGTLDDPVLLGRLWTAIAFPARLRGDFKKASIYFSQSVRAYSQTNDQLNEAIQILSAAITRLQLSEVSEVDDADSRSLAETRARVSIDILRVFRIFFDHRSMTGLTWTCAVLCKLAASEGQWGRCVTLFYACDRLKAQHDVLFAKFDLAMVTQALEMARAALPPTQFDAAQRTGKSLSVQALAKMVLAS